MINGVISDSIVTAEKAALESVRKFVHTINKMKSGISYSVRMLGGYRTFTIIITGSKAAADKDRGYQTKPTHVLRESLSEMKSSRHSPTASFLPSTPRTSL